MSQNPPRASPAVRYPKPFADNIGGGSRQLAIIIEALDRARQDEALARDKVDALRAAGVTGAELFKAKLELHHAEIEYQKTQELYRAEFIDRARRTPGVVR